MHGLDDSLACTSLGILEVPVFQGLDETKATYL